MVKPWFNISVHMQNLCAQEEKAEQLKILAMKNSMDSIPSFKNDFISRYQAKF